MDGKPTQNLVNRHRWRHQRVCLLENDSGQPLGRSIEELSQKIIGRSGFDPKWLQRMLGEVPEVPRDDDIGSAVHGGREDVTITLVVAHPTDQVLESRDHSRRERTAHRHDQSMRLVFAHVAVLDEVAAHLFKDVLTPVRLVHSRRGRAE